jgi:hypothetical protein
MKPSEISLLDYIELYDEQCDVYIHTKDKRVIKVDDVRSNAHIDDSGLYVDHVSLGLRFTLYIPRDDFSHLEYRYSPRTDTSKKEFDELNSFVEEQFEDYEYPSESLTEPLEHLYDDLI